MEGLNNGVKSAGFLIHCSGKYLLCHATSFDGSFSRTDGRWGVPKGIVEFGDSLLDTAFRETLEETGIDVRRMIDNGQMVIKPEYFFRYKTTKKSVYVFYANALTDLTKNTLRCVSKIDGKDLPENDAFCWVDWASAFEMVSKRQKELFSEENRLKLVD